MSMPLRQSVRIGSYLLRQKLARRDKFPLLVELEPLFACNLKCAGCGKIQQPHDVLKQRMPVEQALGAIEECGAPMVSIAGGEPLMHPQIDEIVRQLIARKKFVFLCTNALLMPKKIDKFTPSPYFSWVVHIDGLRERHDESVCKEGVFDDAVAAIKECQRRGFRVNTNTTFFNTDTPQTIIDVLNFLNDDLKIDDMQISPAYAYEKAPDQDHFLGVTETRELFKKAFGDGNRKRWRHGHWIRRWHWGGSRRGNRRRPRRWHRRRRIPRGWRSVSSARHLRSRSGVFRGSAQSQISGQRYAVGYRRLGRPSMRPARYALPRDGARRESHRCRAPVALRACDKRRPRGRCSR